MPIGLVPFDAEKGKETPLEEGTLIKLVESTKRNWIGMKQEHIDRHH